MNTVLVKLLSRQWLLQLLRYALRDDLRTELRLFPNTKVFLRSNDMWEKQTLARPVGLQTKIGGNCTFFSEMNKLICKQRHASLMMPLIPF